jgi:hypothetical protein
MSGFDQSDAWLEYFRAQNKQIPSGWRGAIELTENFEGIAPDYLKGAVS